MTLIQIDPEVDVVISTEEFQNLLEKLENLKPKSLVQNQNQETIFDKIPQNDTNNNLTLKPIPNQNSTQFYGSDSYLNYIYRRLEHENNLKHIENIEFKKYRGKNKDFNTCELITPSKTYKFAAIYGFKSIQQLIRLIKTKKCDFDYIEIMACPSGCLNGGGQIKYKGVSRDEQLEKLALVESEFLKSGLLSWPEVNESYFNGLKSTTFETYFSDPEKVNDNKDINGQNLILLAANW